MADQRQHNPPAEQRSAFDASEGLDVGYAVANPTYFILISL
jgi:hypothetical protein